MGRRAVRLFGLALDGQRLGDQRGQLLYVLLLTKHQRADADPDGHLDRDSHGHQYPDPDQYPDQYPERHLHTHKDSHYNPH